MPTKIIDQHLPVASIGLSEEERLLKAYWEEFYPAVLDLVQGLTGDDALAEEVSQLAFIRLWENRHLLSRRQEIKPFLFAVARTKIMSMRLEQGSKTFSD